MNKKIEKMAIVYDGQVRMANLSVASSHSVNGVSKLHSEIIKERVFHDEFCDTPEKFTNVTNGIAYRRWLYQSNPALTDLLHDTIGGSFLKNGAELSKFRAFENDETVLKRLLEVKRGNKEAFAKYVKQKTLNRI